MAATTFEPKGIGQLRTYTGVWQISEKTTYRDIHLQSQSLTRKFHCTTIVFAKTHLLKYLSVSLAFSSTHSNAIHSFTFHIIAIFSLRLFINQVYSSLGERSDLPWHSVSAVPRAPSLSTLYGFISSLSNMDTGPVRSWLSSRAQDLAHIPHVYVYTYAHPRRTHRHAPRFTEQLLYSAHSGWSQGHSDTQHRHLRVTDIRIILSEHAKAHDKEGLGCCENTTETHINQAWEIREDFVNIRPTCMFLSPL